MTSGKVLIVDDNPENLRALGNLLEDAGYDLRVASSGEQALAMVQSELPDIILLDVLMPGWDGHEVCRRLKNDPDTAEIPVVFMTSYNEEADEAAGLDLGAVDFVMKPFRFPVVLRRIANHLAYRRMKNELKDQTAGLEQLVVRRTEELKQANGKLTKLDATKALYLTMLAHELRAPAEGLVGIGELALQGIEDFTKRDRLRVLFRAQKERLDTLFGQYQRLIDWQQKGKGKSHKTAPVRLDELLIEAWEARIEVLGARHITPPAGPEVSLLVYAEPKLLQSVIDGVVRWIVALAKEGTAILAGYRDSADEIRVSWSLAGTWPVLAESTLSAAAENNELAGPDDVRTWLPLLDTTIDALGGSVTVSANEQLEVVLRLQAFRTR